MKWTKNWVAAMLMVPGLYLAGCGSGNNENDTTDTLSTQSPPPADAGSSTMDQPGTTGMDTTASARPGSTGTTGTPDATGSTGTTGVSETDNTRTVTGTTGETRRTTTARRAPRRRTTASTRRTTTDRTTVTDDRTMTTDETRTDTAVWNRTTDDTRTTEDTRDDQTTGDTTTSRIRALGDSAASTVDRIGDTVASRTERFGDTVSSRLERFGDTAADRMDRLGDTVTSRIREMGEDEDSINLRTDTSSTMSDSTRRDQRNITEMTEENRTGNISDSADQETMDSSGNVSTMGAGMSFNPTVFIPAQIRANYAEIKLASLALERSDNEEIKRIAGMLETDHNAALRELQALAGNEDAALADSLPNMESDHAKHHLDMMRNLAIDEFNSQWLSHMHMMHDQKIQMFEQAVANNSIQDEEIRAWVTKILPTLRKHRDDLAQAMNNTNK